MCNRILSLYFSIFLADSQKASSDANENSDSSKKKEKQKLLKKLQEVEKLINQRATKASS